MLAYEWACLFSQIEQGIERKYLIPPLGEDDETKKRRQQEAADAAKRELNDVMTKKKKEKGGQGNDGEKLGLCLNENFYRPY